jgi:hypothetical protein
MSEAGELVANGRQFALNPTLRWLLAYFDRPQISNDSVHEERHGARDAYITRTYGAGIGAPWRTHCTWGWPPSPLRNSET